MPIQLEWVFWVVYIPAIWGFNWVVHYMAFAIDWRGLTSLVRSPSVPAENRGRSARGSATGSNSFLNRASPLERASADRPADEK